MDRKAPEPRCVNHASVGTITEMKGRMHRLRQFDHYVAPSSDQIVRYGRFLGVDLDEEDAELLPRWLADALGQLEALDDLPEEPVPLIYTNRDPGRSPKDGEDPCNAFIRFCEVRGAPSGPLAGKRLAVKDCIAVAGVPQSDGGGRRPHLVPTEDSVVVERVLAAGATIVGKANMEDFAVGSGEGSYFGASCNPRNRAFSTGGSSSGSAAAVASALADMALGSDQGGSIRIPASWCGLVGMKATHGLVPSHGLTHIDHTIDHIGPMTTSVADNAVLLEVIAGDDPRDPQWARLKPEARPYTQTAGHGIDGIRIGVIAEAVRPEIVSPDVLEAFTGALDAAMGAGAKIEEVSVPLWSVALPLFSAVVSHAFYGMWMSHGLGFGHMGRVDVDAVAGNAMRTPIRSHHLPPRLLTRLFLANYLHDSEWSVPLAKAHNLRIRLQREIDDLFAHVDIVLVPTVVSVAFRLLGAREGARADRMSRGASTALNTCALDLSGHPALSMPCGTGADELPVGVQIIGPSFGEEAIYQVAFALEESLG